MTKTTTTTTTTVTTVTETKTEPRVFKKTRIVSIGDRSGSMATMINDAIGGINSFVNEQKKVPGQATFSLVLFDSMVDMAIPETDIQMVPKITNEMWYPRGSTSLLDAVGMTINRLKATHQDDVKTILTVMTDGEENTSREYSYSQVSSLIKEVEEKLGWDVLFMGANIDVAKMATQMNLSAGKFASFEATGKGMQDQFTAMAAATTAYRGFGEVKSMSAYMQDAQ